MNIFPKRVKGKQKRWTRSDKIMCVILACMVVFMAYHMFSFFLRLVFPSNNAANEFSSIMGMVRDKQIPFGTWTYLPIAVLVKILSIFFSEAKIYKAFILVEILINIFFIWSLYVLLIKLFGSQLKRITLMLISVACYFGMPGYCFLYGGNLKCTIWLMVFFFLLYILYQKRIIVERIINTLPDVFWKIISVFVIVFSYLFLCRGLSNDFVYFIPIELVIMLRAFWKDKEERLLGTVYSFVVVLESFVIFAVHNEAATESVAIGMASLYWCIMWIMVAQVIYFAKQENAIMILGAYAGFLLILLFIQISGVDEHLREERWNLVSDETIYDTEYFHIYGNNIEMLKSNYTDNDHIFYGSAEFIDLAEQAMSYSKDELLVLSDEITETDRTWFTAIADRDYVEIDGLNSTDEDISKVLREQNPEYVVIFTNSRIYMAHYEFVSEYPHIYENERGMILERPEDGW